MITSELSGGARFAELASWPQHERDLAAETIYRFVFRSLYEVRAFNGDPHPGNYLFHRGGKVTFLDFGLVRHFTPAELQPLLAMARTICVEHDPEAFRASLENAGFLRPGAPLSTQAITDHLAVFYDTIREPGPLTITSDYASSVVRRFFDLRSPVAGLRLIAPGGARAGRARRGRYAASAPRLFAAAGEQRQLLREDLALQTAEDVAGTLGAMKGVMMKIGQMASYVDDGLSPAVRGTLARLQDSVPPMSPQLAAAVVEEELGAPPERAFARWDPRPIAAASIGQVHRAVTLDGRAVAVKVQYPGIAETIAADLRNVALLRRMLRIAAPAQDVDALLSELRDRIGEELDYRREAASQRLMAAYYDGHPTIAHPRDHRRAVHPPGDHQRAVRRSPLRRTRQLAPARTRPGRRDDLPLRLPQPVRRARLQRRPAPGQLPVPPRRQGHLPGLRAGQALHPRRTAAAPGRWPAPSASSTTPRRSARSLENAGFLRPGAPLSTQAIIEHLAVFYDTIREPGPLTITSDYASSVVRRFFDLRSPVAGYIAVPQPYVILQRINLGLFAVLGELSATADWRAIAEEIWPFTHGPASTPMGQAEAAWQARRQAMAA